jgi:hypothetical protein
VTNDLVRRVDEHKSKAIPSFTAKYGVDRLVWLETRAEEVAAGLEDPAYRRTESRLARPLSDARSLKASFRGAGKAGEPGTHEHRPLGIRQNLC